MSLPLQDITEGRALLARSKDGEPGAREALGAWFEAWGGMVLDAFERILAPPPDPRRRFCPECSNRSFWPHTSWCSGRDGAAAVAPSSDERDRYGAPLDPEEAALLQALRARGLGELAEMALYAMTDSVGDAGTALREFEAAPPPDCSLGAAHSSLVPGAKCPTCYFIAPKLPPEIEAVHVAVRVSHERSLSARSDRMLNIDPAARARFNELEPAARAEFMGRPRTLTLGEIEHWYAARGLHVNLGIVGDQITYRFIGLMEMPKP